MFIKVVEVTLNKEAKPLTYVTNFFRKSEVYWSKLM